MNLDKRIKYHVLKNAATHDGKARFKPIIPKLLGEDEGLKKDLKKLIPRIKKVVKEVNGLELEEQEDLLLKMDEHALDTPEEDNVLPDLKNVKQGECSFRLPPGPEKELHIGHALSYLLNNYYAEKYDGKLILRFEDTNPETCKQVFVDGNKQDLKSLGIKWDEEYCLSDNMKDYYNHCTRLIKEKKAYSCTCSSEKMSELRKEHKRCKCAGKPVNSNLQDWNKMKYGTYREGECVIRLKGDMKSKNSVMWDPVLFRVNKTKHYKQGSRYKTWPLYDFTAAIEDVKITHVLRDANWTQRVELQDFIREQLGFEHNPENVLYARYDIQGGVTKGRVIRDLVNNGVVEGYDDIRLATIKGLFRRGILPETFMNLLEEVGITKSKTTIPMKKIYTINRRLLNKRVNRYYFVKEPVLLKVKNAPKGKAEIPLNPYTKKTRSLTMSDEVYINKPDAVKGLIRLKHGFNVKITKVEGKEAIGEYVEEDTITNLPIIQWVPKKQSIMIKVLEPLPLFDEEGKLNENSLITHKGIGEEALKNLPIGEQVQFERFAFVKKEKEQWVLTHE